MPPCYPRPQGQRLSPLRQEAHSGAAAATSAGGNVPAKTASGKSASPEAGTPADTRPRPRPRSHGRGGASFPDLGVAVGSLPCSWLARPRRGPLSLPGPVTCGGSYASCKEAGVVGQTGCVPATPPLRSGRWGGQSRPSAGRPRAHLAEAPPLRRLQELQQEAEFLGVGLCQAPEVPRSRQRVSLLEPEQPPPGSHRRRRGAGERGLLQAGACLLPAACQRQGGTVRVGLGQGTGGVGGWPWPLWLRVGSGRGPMLEGRDRGPGVRPARLGQGLVSQDAPCTPAARAAEEAGAAVGPSMETHPLPCSPCRRPWR